MEEPGYDSSTCIEEEKVLSVCREEKQVAMMLVVEAMT